MYLKATRFVGCGRDHAAPIRCPSHDHGFSSQLRAVTLFDTGVEGIEIDMQDEAGFVHRVHRFSARWLSTLLSLYQTRAGSTRRQLFAPMVHLEERRMPPAASTDEHHRQGTRTGHEEMGRDGSPLAVRCLR